MLDDLYIPSILFCTANMITCLTSAGYFTRMSVARTYSSTTYQHTSVSVTAVSCSST